MAVREMGKMIHLHSEPPYPTPRKLDSMYRQAICVVSILGDKNTADRLDILF